jgi:hypothetical protein
LHQLLEKTFRRPKAQGLVQTRLYFSRSEILVSNLEQQAKRRIGSPTDVRDLSFVLRVVGDYLDKKFAREFSILWTPYSISVGYDGKQEILTVQNVYDFGVNMYLKRIRRVPS